jgi:hypothetical protein
METGAMSTTKWMGIAWKIGSSECVSKCLVAERPITEARALREFKKTFPGLRNYTIHPDNTPVKKP